MRFASISFRVFLLVLLSAVGLSLYEWGRGHPQDLPWTPLSLADPIGRFTTLKLSRLRGDFARCRAILDAGGPAYAIAPTVSRKGACGYSDGVTPRASQSLALVPRVTVACRLQAGLFLWEQQVVQPAAQKYFGVAVMRVDHFGSYACRRIRGAGDRGWSEHASANAIDIAGFRFSDGRRLTVAGAWSAGNRDAAFLHEVRDGACRIFATTLSPEYNALHRDHLHLDMAERGGWSFCR